jgi:hypothetical protein
MKTYITALLPYIQCFIRRTGRHARSIAILVYKPVKLTHRFKRRNLDLNPSGQSCFVRLQTNPRGQRYRSYSATMILLMTDLCCLWSFSVTTSPNRFEIARISAGIGARYTCINILCTMLHKFFGWSLDSPWKRGVCYSGVVVHNRNIPPLPIFWLWTTSFHQDYETVSIESIDDPATMIEVMHTQGKSILRSWPK